MPLTCNIDARGKAARLIYGIILLAIAGWLAYWWAMGSDSAVRWVVAIACAMAGAFGIFEARAGWCIVRAIGVKTPM
ncbi:MAG TPA: hypothetical protein VFC78_13365 [Tepidisphaeraceae bacterium]|nr:hypothetical protein [Tepidisphaeraceae bacterium]